jgi:hypothetical protein
MPPVAAAPKALKWGRFAVIATLRRDFSGSCIRYSGGVPGNRGRGPDADDRISDG